MAPPTSDPSSRALPELRDAPLGLCVAARLGLSCALFVLVTVLAERSDGATITVDPQGEVPTIAEAAKIAQDDDVVEILPGNYRGDVAVWLQKRLTIRGIGETPTLNADGKSAEGKAIWVFRDGEFVVENVAFEGARVADRNGAGIRFERGKLTVRRCRFTDNENGLLTANFVDSELVIEDSQSRDRRAIAVL